MSEAWKPQPGDDREDRTQAVIAEWHASQDRKKDQISGTVDKLMLLLAETQAEYVSAVAEVERLRQYEPKEEISAEPVKG
jgi:dihydrodipicolinate reductase